MFYFEKQARMVDFGFQLLWGLIRNRQSMSPGCSRLLTLQTLLNEGWENWRTVAVVFISAFCNEENAYRCHACCYDDLNLREVMQCLWSMPNTNTYFYSLHTNLTSSPVPWHWGRLFTLPRTLDLNVIQNSFGACSFLSEYSCIINLSMLYYPSVLCFSLSVLVRILVISMFTSKEDINDWLNTVLCKWRAH